MKRIFTRIRDFVFYEHDDLFKLIAAVLILAVGIALICVKSAHAANITDVVSGENVISVTAVPEITKPAAPTPIPTIIPEVTETVAPTSSPTSAPEEASLSDQEQAFYYVLPAFLGFIAGGGLSRSVLGGVLP